MQTERFGLVEKPYSSLVVFGLLLIGSLSRRVFETRTATGSNLFNLRSHNHIHIAKYLFSIRDK